MTQTVSAVSFYLLAVLILVGAVGMIVSRNMMRSAYWLLELSVVSAALFFLLDAHYLALVQLLVYAGAVSILVIFSILITTRGRTDGNRPTHDLKLIPGLLGFAMSALLIATITGLDFAKVTMPDKIPSIVDFGMLLFNPTHWALPFEIASLILTAALVGAVWWAGKGEE